MTHGSRFAALLLVSLPLAGCVWSSQEVRLQPSPRVESGKLGKGRPVFVNTVDERPSETLGHRGVGNVGAEITARDATTIIGNSLSDGLQRLDFKPIDRADGGAPELRAEIRNLTYSISQGFWSGGLDVDVSLKAICIVGDTRPYERLYRGHYDDRIQVVQSAARNEEYINTALNRALEELFGDARLMTCLARE